MLATVLLPMLTTLAGGAVATTATTLATADEPPIRVWLDQRSYERGDRARVHVRARDDGYLIVLHVAPDGRLRVLFPLDPGDDNYIRGLREYEIRARGDRDAIDIDAPDGTGTVYAAISRDPFRFDSWVRNDHWDYRVLENVSYTSDPEAQLTDLVEQMAGTARFDYDLVHYDVERPSVYATTYYPPVIASPPCWWDPWYDPWCRPVYGYPTTFLSINLFFGHRRPFFFGYGPFYPRHPFGFCRFCYRGPIVIGRPRYGGYVPIRPFGGYTFKPGSPGGVGTGPGVRYRPRSPAIFTGGGSARSPLFPATRFGKESAQLATTYRRRGASEGVTVHRGGEAPVIEGRAGIGGKTVFATPDRGDAVGGRRGVRIVSPQMDPRAEPRTEGRALSRAEPRSAPRAGLRSDPAFGAPSAPRTETRDAPRIEPRAEPRAEPRTMPRPEPRAEPRPEYRPEPRAAPRSEPRSEPRVIRSEPRAAERPARAVSPARSSTGSGGGGMRGGGRGGLGRRPR